LLVVPAFVFCRDRVRFAAMPPPLALPLCILAVLAASGGAVLADPIEDFYKGLQIGLSSAPTAAAATIPTAAWQPRRRSAWLRCKRRSPPWWPIRPSSPRPAPLPVELISGDEAQKVVKPDSEATK
jgi:hypothetical protein